MFRFLQFAIRCAMRLLYRVKTEGLMNFPAEGPVVVCANHTFMKDLLVVGCFAPRRIRWIAKAELFRVPVFARLLRYLGAFPVKRGEHDRDAVKTVYGLLRAGEPLGIFPEGTRATDPRKRPPVRRGFVSFAINTGAVILPVSVGYGNGPFGRGRLFCGISLSFGIAVTPEPGKEYTRKEQDTLADEVMSGIYEKICYEADNKDLFKRR